MALYSLRFRRALSLSSTFINGAKPFSSISTSPSIPSTKISNPRTSLTGKFNFLHLLNQFQCRSFQSSTVSLSSRLRSPPNENERIDPDAILFEGCDYNHWLITMDFPKDPRPTPEEMVETYVQTAAKVLGSVEEAKKRIYACSTTTYHGFQVEVTEEMSKKFEGLPGVVFILPDSYIDPQNKEYGGDKYENGKITHRPPPVQYQRGGRYNDRNRNRGPYQQGGYENQGPNQNYGGQQNSQQLPQNYGPPGGNVRRDPMPMGDNNSPPMGQDGYQRERRDPVPPYQRNYGPPQGGNYGPPQGGNYGPPQGGNYGPRQGGNYGPPQGGNYGQGQGGGYAQGASGGYGQGAGGNYGQQQGQGGFGSHVQGPGGGNWQGEGGSYRQGGGAGYGQGGGGAQGQEGYNQGENEFGQGQQRNNAATGETGIGQGRY